MLDRADIEAGHIAQFGSPGLATVTGQVEERVVHRLGHDSEGVIVLGNGGAAQEHGGDRAEHDGGLGHGSLLLFGPAFGQAASVAGETAPPALTPARLPRPDVAIAM